MPPESLRKRSMSNRMHVLRLFMVSRPVAHAVSASSIPAAAISFIFQIRKPTRARDSRPFICTPLDSGRVLKAAPVCCDSPYRPQTFTRLELWRVLASPDRVRVLSEFRELASEQHLQRYCGRSSMKCPRARKCSWSRYRLLIGGPRMQSEMQLPEQSVRRG